MSTATKMPPKPPPRQRPAAETSPTNGTPKNFSLERVSPSRCHRSLIYGTGGIGKSSLACLASTVAGPIAFFDLDDSLGKIKEQCDQWQCDVRQVPGVETWDNLRGALHADIWQDMKTICIDSLSRAEELALEWTLANTRHEHGYTVPRLEDYGFGKGYQHIYETFLALFGDLDQHIRQGRNVILVCHEVTANVPNPAGEDFLRWEPRLQHPSSQKSSIRLKAKEWADHVFYVGYDVVATKDGKAIGGNTRTIYCREMPWFMAKSRTLSNSLVFKEGSNELWKQLYQS